MELTKINSSARRVAIYARVSTDHEAQLLALENQKDWYSPILEQNKEWTLIRMYVDEGITGTSAKKRPEFLRMIEDAEKGLFDLILTREVTRFARNTVDTLQYTRHLKSCGVEVFFINDNIKTFDGDGELRLTIMASLAQDESRKTSLRVKSGLQTAAEKGVVFGNGNILGYDRVGKKMILNEEQRATVKRIFDLRLLGYGFRKIKTQLELEKRLTATGKTVWAVGTIAAILRNPFYCGIVVYHKSYVVDYLEQKKIRNFGEIPLTTTKGDHTPIVTVEEFLRCQEITENSVTIGYNERGKRKTGKKPFSNCWTQLLQCECGNKCYRKKGKTGQIWYICKSVFFEGTVKRRAKQGLPTDDYCKTRTVPEWKLNLMARHIFRNYIHNSAEIIELAQKMLEKHIDEKNVDEIKQSISEKKKAIEKMTKRISALISMRADGEISKDEFISAKTEIEQNIANIQKELRESESEIEVGTEYHAERMMVLKKHLEEAVDPADETDLSEDVIRAFVKKIVLHEDSFDWYLRFDPSETPLPLSIEGDKIDKATVNDICSIQPKQHS